MAKNSSLAYVGTIFAMFLHGAPDASAKPTGAVQAKIMCGACHDTSGTKTSSHEISDGSPPPFLLIAADPKMSPEELRRFLKLPHGNMDNVMLTGGEVDALITYIQSLKSRAPY